MASRNKRRTLGASLLAASTSAVVLATSAGAALPTVGAKAAGAKPIHPGVTVNYGDVSCAVGAVLHHRKKVYLAVPASCGGIDAGKANNTCYGPMTPVGSPVSIEGAKHRGRLVYSSYTQMQLRGERSARKCSFNDLTLVRVNRHDVHLVSGTIPGTSAPRRIASTLPNDGTSLSVGTKSATAGSTYERGWSLDVNLSGMFKTADVGTAVTAGRTLVGMLVVLPKGPIPNIPLLQAPAEVFNLSRAITELHRTPGFRHVTLLKAGQRP